MDDKPLRRPGRVIRKNKPSGKSAKKPQAATRDSFAALLAGFSKHPQLAESSFKRGHDLYQVPPAALGAITYYRSFSEGALKNNLVLVLPTEKEARKIYDELTAWEEAAEGSSDETLGSRGNIHYLPLWGNLPLSYGLADNEKQGYRSRAMTAILYHRQPALYVVSVDALSAKVPQKDFYTDLELQLKESMEISMNEIADFLTEHGYEREEVVEAPGQFSQKGSIMDIYCPGYFDPVRLDFFGDEIESLRFFDPLTQVSTAKITSIVLFSRYDLPFKNEDFNLLYDSMKDSGKDLPPVLTTSAADRHGLWDVYPLMCKTGLVLDLFAEPPDVLVYDYSAIIERIDNIASEIRFLREKNSHRLLAADKDLFASEEELLPVLEQATKINYVSRSTEDFSVKLKPAPVFKGRISYMVQELDQTGADKEIFISVSGTDQKERLSHILEAYPEKKIDPHIFISNLRNGFEWQQGLLLTEHEIFGRSVQRLKVAKSTSQVIESFVDLNEGDYVVHVNYGIGRFVRLKRMTVAQTERDFLELEYADQDKLYIPLEQLNLVHRYIGSTENPKLDYLGKKSSWQKTRARVSESIENLAAELLELYAKRENARGIAFAPDSRFQEEFEAAFAFEETDHQISAITEVKKDMESVKPMDRLICGDVGFGKTEVAIRAAFKCVMAGKQAALLCPTTILAFQHYNTFRHRFKEYPVSIEFISRFRTAGEVKKVREKLKDGSVDIVIGTHALLTKTIEFKNLGLLIIDEEQRFGVSHKEAIKKLKANIDTLTLTATPIPRTLHMSLVGIRDLSLIETPPRNRQKIETWVVEENDELLRQAIKKELERGGQVYVLHNQVKTIEAQARRIHGMLPSARTAVLHGKMSEEEIEITMLDFYKHSYDILVSTTIIESGIDIPNVNTLIVMNAQNFGLSQLYQIKGRVGRSERQAYAYFFYPANKSLTETAQKRLNTLQEYDGLGAGFKIAMKDLEIRGAGNLLGKEQSGDILDVGFELYVQMLQEKLAELREEEKDDFEAVVSIPQDFYFDDNYIHDTRQKMEFYKKLASCRTIEAIENVAAELEDRFGRPPQLVQAMVQYETVRVLANRLKLDKIEHIDNDFILTASPETTLSMQKLGPLIANDRRFIPDPDDVRKIKFRPQAKELLKSLEELSGILDYLS